MKGSRFDKRLEAVIRCALQRLHSRMKFAYQHGGVRDYLDRVGLTVQNEDEPLTVARFQHMWEMAGKIMAEKIRRARQKGYLREYMQRMNMSDIIMFSARTEALSLVPAVSVANPVALQGGGRHLQLVK